MADASEDGAQGEFRSSRDDADGREPVLDSIFIDQMFFRSEP